MIDQSIKVAVDAIVFGYSENKLYVLLVQQKYGIIRDKWGLVGGFVKDNEGLSDAINRELMEEAGIKVSYLEQLYTFGDAVERDPRFRVISVSYFALVDSSQFKLKAGSDAKKAQWFSINELPHLAYDHADILSVAIKRLQNKLAYKPIGFDLLPKEFLFSDLENLYTTILQKDIDRRNFRKKILSFGLLEETKKVATGKGGRPAKFFKFNNHKYNKLIKEGFHFEISFA